MMLCGSMLRAEVHGKVTWDLCCRSEERRVVGVSESFWEKKNKEREERERERE